MGEDLGLSTNSVVFDSCPELSLHQSDFPWLLQLIGSGMCLVPPDECGVLSNPLFRGGDPQAPSILTEPCRIQGHQCLPAIHTTTPPLPNRRFCSTHTLDLLKEF